VYDAQGLGGVFGMVAAMYVVFAVCVQIPPETYGRSLDDGQLADESSTRVGKPVTPNPVDADAI
jgi:putative MFS transporter